MKLYTDLRFRVSHNFDALMPIVRAQLDSVSERERIKKHHARATSFQLVDSIEDSDLCVLPDSWGTYVKQGLIGKAQEFASICATQGKLILVWCAGDPERIVPIPNAVQVQEGLHRGLRRQVAYAFERPSFLKRDYIQFYRDGNWTPFPWSEKPVVGFCGQAATRMKSRMAYYLRSTVQHLKFRVGIARTIPPLHGYHVDLRRRVLGKLEEDAYVETNFNIRKQYRAGVSGKIEYERLVHPTRFEFVENIMNSMYIVCVRGGGNYSKRFYEALCCGRLPVLIDTNAVLPFDHSVDWDRFLIRVPVEELDCIGEIVNDFHSRLTPELSYDLQLACRELWLNRLSVSGYYEHFHEYLSVTQNWTNRSS